MQESREQIKIYGLLQFAIFFIVLIDVLLNCYYPYINGVFVNLISPFAKMRFFATPLYSKILVLIVSALVAIGTKARINIKLNVFSQIILPFLIGIIMLFGSLYLIPYFTWGSDFLIPYTPLYQLGYIFLSLIGAILALVGMSNTSKLIKSNLGKDVWNVEEESFMQDTELIETETSINIPTLFYYKRKVYKGWINMNPFRGVMVIGTPGSGKSFGVINPCIRQMIQKGFTLCIYDFKFPTLANIALYQYINNQRQGKYPNYKFHVINVNDVESSVRVNPLATKYISSLIQATEVSESLVKALKKGDSKGESFFDESAINFLTACIYFFNQYENGKYSTLPHILSFITMSYDKIFPILFSNTELIPLLSPFISAHEKKAYEQLEGQVGTLKIFLSKLATKETYFVFGQDDVPLNISNPDNPTVFIMASDPDTQSASSTLYSLVVNRIINLVNRTGNLPTGIIVDEVPTLYLHKIENLIATARSNKVGVVLGLQELPQFKQQYGDKTADTISSVIGNVLSGSARSKQTLEWLQTLAGKKKQMGESLNIDKSRASINFSEKLDNLIPTGKIANLKTGEMVGVIAKDVNHNEYGKEYITSAVNCKIDINMKEVEAEEESFPFLKMPVYHKFGEDKEVFLKKNFDRIFEETTQVVNRLLEEIKSEKV